MPTYVYRFIDSGKIIEVQQAFSDDPFTTMTDPADGTVRAVKKVFTPVGVSFRGDGFYKTDSRTKSSSTSAPTTPTSAGSESTSNGDSAAKSDSSSSSETSTSPASTPASSTPASTSASTPGKESTSAPVTTVTQ